MYDIHTEFFCDSDSSQQFKVCLELLYWEKLFSSNLYIYDLLKYKYPILHSKISYIR